MKVKNILEMVQKVKEVDEFAYTMYGAIACNSSMKLSHNAVVREVLYDNLYLDKHGARIVEPELVGLLHKKDFKDVSQKVYDIIQLDRDQEEPLDKNDYWYEYLKEWYSQTPEEILYYVPTNFSIEYERQAIEKYTGQKYEITDMKQHKILISIFKDIIMKYRELQIYAQVLHNKVKRV